MTARSPAVHRTEARINLERSDCSIGQGGPPGCQGTLAVAGVELVESLRHHQLEHGVAQELEPLVRPSGGGPFLGAGGMGQGAGQEPGIAESVAQPALQRLKGVGLRNGHGPGEFGLHDEALE